MPNQLYQKGAISLQKLRFFLMIALTTFLMGCQPEGAPSLRFGVLGAAEAIPIAMAQHLGYLDQVEIIVFTSARERDAAMQAGALDGIVTDLVAVSLYREAGFGLQITGAAAGTFALIANADFSEVALSSNTAAELFFDLLELEAKKIEIPAIPARLEMLREQQVEAAILPEPFASLAMSRTQLKVGSTKDIGFNPFVTAFTEGAIANKTAAVTAFFAAYDKAVAYLNENPLGPYEAFLSQMLGFPLEAWAAYELPVFLKNSPPSDEDIKLTVDWLLGKELISSRFSPSDLMSPVPFW